MTSTNEIAGRWLRVSTGGQDERDQEPDIDRWIEDHGYAVGPTYRLHGASASKGKQDKMIERVLDDMRAGRITVLVVWYSARIERRGAYDHFSLAHMIREAGGRIEYVKEPWLNETNSMSDVMLALAAGANKQYSDTLSMNVKKAFDAIDGNGAVRGRAIFGYKIVGERKNKRFEMIDSEARLIRDATDWYLAGGESLAMICRKLNSARRLPRSGSEWSPKTLGQVLRSETIMGRHHQGSKIVRVPAILTVREWRQLQAKLDQRAYRKGVRTHQETAFLTSILYCDQGHPLYRVKMWDGKQAYYDSKCPRGERLSIPLDVADEIVFTGIMDMDSDPSVEALTREVLIKGHNFQDDIDRMALDIQALDPTAPGWLAEVTAMRAEIDRLASLPSEPDHVETVPVDWSDFRAEWKKNMTTAERRELLISLGLRFIARKVDGEVVLSPRMPLPEPVR